MPSSASWLTVGSGRLMLCNSFYDGDHKQILQVCQRISKCVIWMCQTCMYKLQENLSSNKETGKRIWHKKNLITLPDYVCVMKHFYDRVINSSAWPSDIESFRCEIRRCLNILFEVLYTWKGISTCFAVIIVIHAM